MDQAQNIKGLDNKLIDTSTAARELADILDRLGRLLHYRQFSAGLNPAQWEALRFLARANRYSRNPGALAEYLGTTKGTASQTLIALEEKSLIARIRGRQDRRQVLLELTEAGRAALDNDPVVEIAQAAGRVGGIDVTALTRGLSALFLELRQAREHPIFGNCGQCAHLGSREREADPSGPHCCRLREAALSNADLDQVCVDFCATPDPGRAPARPLSEGEPRP